MMLNVAAVFLMEEFIFFFLLLISAFQMIDH